MINIISSTTDIASKNIMKFIPESKKYKLISNKDSLNYNGEKSELNIFVSKHESEKKIKSLTCHTPGNFGKAIYGGTDNNLSISNAKIQTLCMRELFKLNERNQWEFRVGFEVTHHGPSLNNPCIFVEIGSSAKEWNQLRYCSGIAKVTLKLVNDYNNIMNRNQTVAIGIGGGHYAPDFTKLVLKDSSLSIGHICPNYALEHLNKDMFKQMISKTVPEPALVIISKSVKSNMRKQIISWCDELDLNHLRLK